jgi:SAM-dependent methyltransferase
MEESLRDEDTPAQVTFIVDVLGAKPPMKFLDVGCGHGRHANELARRGFSVVGVDLVEGFVERARQEAEREDLDARFERADMATFDAPDASFDRAVCLFDAFGFFDDMHQLHTLKNVHRMLNDAGKFLLDLRTREWMVRVPPVSVLDKGNGDMMIDRHHFDIATSRFVDRRTYVRGGAQREVVFSVRLWAFTEIRLVLGSVGFEVENVYGGFDGSPLSAQKPRTVLVCKKVEPPKPPPP